MFEAALSPSRRRSHWWWAAGNVAVLALLLAIGRHFLDPWLRRTLEQQVATRTGGRYHLRIGQLQTSLWHRSLYLRNIQLRPAGSPAWGRNESRWPRLLADIPVLRIAGVGIWAAVCGRVVPVDTVLLAGARLRVLQLPPGLIDGQPLYQWLPVRVKGLRVNLLGIMHLQAAYEISQAPAASVRDASITAADVLLSRAGAEDTARLAYARTLRFDFAGVAATAHQHHLAIAQGFFSTARHRLALKNLHLRPLIGAAAPRVPVALTVGQLQLTGVAVAGLRRNLLRCDSLVLEQPHLLAALPTAPLPPFHQVLAPYLQQAQVGHVVLRHGFIHLTGSAANPTVRDLTLDGADLRVDAVGARAPARILYARAWNLHTGAITGVVDVPYYRVACAGLHAVTGPGLLEVRGARLTPTVTPAQLAARKHHQSPHFTVRLPLLRLTGLDYALLAHRHALRVRDVLVNQPVIHVAGDARFSLNLRASIITPETLGHLPFSFDVRRLRFVEGNLYTAYVAPKGGRGLINFNHLDATLTNLTNDPRRMSWAHPLVVHGSGRLQDQCAVRLTIWVPLLDPLGTHWGEATFGPAPFAMLNTMTQPTRLVRFVQGRIQHIHLTLRVNRNRAQGAMQAQYAGLKLALLTRHGGADNQNLLTKIGSKVLNGLVVRDNNPRHAGESPKTGVMESRRDRRFSVVVFWRQNLISGLLNSAGVPQKLAVLIGQQQ